LKKCLWKYYELNILHDGRKCETNKKNSGLTANTQQYAHVGTKAKWTLKKKEDKK